MITAHNPILTGFYPDPSICAVGKDFYLVNSTFAYFPGLPVFHSTDLIHWEQIGNALDRPDQICLEGCRHSQGIYAPTIRYHEGTFYLVTTYSSGPGSFILTAKDPAGPWSDPYWLGEDAPGIDPSLFFDEDGRCYYVGTRPNPAGVRYNGDWEIWVQELDLHTMKLTGESHAVWKGALKNVIWPEGPHLYKHDGYYYLMNAEGGTGPDHCVSIARSEQVYGPYVGNPDNPILTHRHLGRNYPVTCAGHGDLVEDADGNWYMVLLACRPRQGHTLLGRETFLAKVVWENGWPVVNPGVGRLEEEVTLPFTPPGAPARSHRADLCRARPAQGVPDPAGPGGGYLPPRRRHRTADRKAAARHPEGTVRPGLPGPALAVSPVPDHAGHALCPCRCQRVRRAGPDAEQHQPHPAGRMSAGGDLVPAAGPVRKRHRPGSRRHARSRRTAGIAGGGPGPGSPAVLARHRQLAGNWGSGGPALSEHRVRRRLYRLHRRDVRFLQRAAFPQHRRL